MFFHKKGSAVPSKIKDFQKVKKCQKVLLALAINTKSSKKHKNIEKPTLLINLQRTITHLFLYFEIMSRIRVLSERYPGIVMPQFSKLKYSRSV